MGGVIDYSVRQVVWNSPSLSFATILRWEEAASYTHGIQELTSEPTQTTKAGAAHLLIQAPDNHQVRSSALAVALRLHPRGPLGGEKVTGALEWQPRLGALLAGACRVARIKEVICSPNGADGEDWGGECWTPGLRVGATETRPRLKDGARRIREPWGSRAGSTCPRLDRKSVV